MGRRYSEGKALSCQNKAVQVAPKRPIGAETFGNSIGHATIIALKLDPESTPVGFLRVLEG